MEVEKKKCVVVGTGISGIGATNLLTAKGASVVLFDENKERKVEDVLAKLDYKDKVEIILGELSDEYVKRADLLVLSPGVPVDTPFVERFKKNKVTVWGEIELGYRLGKGTVIGITGTNGKTTTTTLVGEIMSNYYKSVFVVGNIGNPYTTVAEEMKDESIVVAEISSFQLETIEEFKPHVSAVLNVTPDHLNRHHTMDVYAGCKADIAKNQDENDVCVLNYDNEYTRKMAQKTKAKVCFFSSKEKLEDGIYLEKDTIYLAKEGVSTPIFRTKETSLVGVCNYENIMAAILISLGNGVDLESILDTIRKFKAVEHRIEFVATKNGVDYYNDSKGTNPDAAIQGIKAMTKPTILIGGGYDKQNEFDEWIEAFDGKVKLLVLIGQTKDKIASCAKKHGFTDYCFADTFEEAFAICSGNASPGDAVLLSPACASWGMFDNYEQRGRVFKDMVCSLS